LAIQLKAHNTVNIKAERLCYISTFKYKGIPIHSKVSKNTQATFSIERGDALPLGSTLTKKGVNFSIFSEHATQVTLVLFTSGVDAPITTFELSSSENTTGSIWHILVKGIDPKVIRYGYRMNMQPNPNPQLYRFDPESILIDPYAKAISGASEWGVMYTREGQKPPVKMGVRDRRSIIGGMCFDWGDDKQLCTPPEEMIIYELHVRGYTAHSSSKVDQKGTYLGLCEKIPYLKELGVTTVELLPVFEFEETAIDKTNPETEEKLLNFWGYDPINFFSPKAAYASDGRNGKQINEFKKMIRTFHQAGIEVILDVVFNHTAEGDKDGHIFNYRGIDNPTYYIVDSESGEYKDYTGCGNTVNCNNPVVRDMIIDALRHWVIEMHVDGFRFDLASILGRDEDGEVLSNPPIIERIAYDPVLTKTKLIAEAWDAAGLYQVGSFPAYDRWAEWNGKFRDDIRSFVKSDSGKVKALAQRLMGSPDVYRQSGRSPFYSVNFITCHDGFTLRDLVSYDQKHNLQNGEKNRDGSNDNSSWNCGVEGKSDDPAIETLRLKQQKNMALLLILSDGIPMILAGDEFGRTQKGNNNAYCQDNDTSWIDWTLLEKHSGLFRFFRLLIQHKKEHLLSKLHDYVFDDSNSPDAEIHFHGIKAGEPDWSDASRTLGLQVHATKKSLNHDKEEEVDIYIYSNAHWKAHQIELPLLKEGVKWYRLVDTGKVSPEDFLEVELLLEDQKHYDVMDRSTVMLLGK